MTTPRKENNSTNTYQWYILTLKEYNFENPVASWTTEKQITAFCDEVMRHTPDTTAFCRVADLDDPADKQLIASTLENWMTSGDDGYKFYT